MLLLVQKAAWRRADVFHFCFECRAVLTCSHLCTTVTVMSPVERGVMADGGYDHESEYFLWNTVNGMWTRLQYLFILTHVVIYVTLVFLSRHKRDPCRNILTPKTPQGLQGHVHMRGEQCGCSENTKGSQVCKWNWSESDELNTQQMAYYCY